MESRRHFKIAALLILASTARLASPVLARGLSLEEVQESAHSSLNNQVVTAVEYALAHNIGLSAVLASPSETGVRLLEARVREDRANFEVHIILDFSAELLRYGLGAEMESVLDQILTEVGNLPDLVRTADEEDAAFRYVNFTILIEGIPLQRYFEAVQPDSKIEPESMKDTWPSQTSMSISGRRVAISPGHGWYLHESLGWSLQRPWLFGIVEDFVNAEIVMHLKSELSSVGVDVRPTREMSKSAGSGVSGKPKWEEGAKYYIQSLGAPSSVWDVGDTELNKDIGSRPRYANWINADVLVSIHNNADEDAGTATGTETLYDNSNGFALESKRLADAVHNSVVNTIRQEYNGAWVDRLVKGLPGDKGENRIATRPAIIVEVAFMTQQSPDNDALHDENFKQLVARAVRNGLQEYFGPPTSTGTLTVSATLDGAPWSGPVSYSVSGATSFTGFSTGSHPNLPTGGYTVQYLSGGPGGFVDIVPAASQLLVAGGTISWTLRFGTSCTAGSSSLRLATCPPPPPTLSVTLAANPEAGTAPLNDVDLTATVSGSATGTINYTFYCDRDDSGTNITPNPSAKYDGISTNPKTAANVCDYTVADTYTAKVIVERGALAAEARRTITVGGSSSPVPEVTTLAATSVTQASATFNATVHPKNSATTFWFDYGTTTSVSQSTTTQTLAAATSASAVSISQGGLSCGQQYFYRIRASNAGGPATPGSILSFTTDSCGSGGSQSVQLVADPSFEAGNNAWWVANPAFYIKGTPTFPNPRTGSKYAFLSNLDGSRGNNLSGGMISPSVTIPADATDADLRFYYSITSDETTSTQIFDKVDVYLVRPGNQLNLITTISNLDENGTSYSLESEDLSSSFYGDTVQIFFAGSTDGTLPTVFRIDDVTLDVDLPSASAPEVTTEAADQVNASSARLNMTVNPHGANTEVWFDLEAGDSTPNDDTQHISIGAGSQNESVSIAVFGLQCGTLYYFQAEASNSEGSDSGSVRSFTTLPCAGNAPNADTDPAENITQTSATLTADVNPNGLSTQAWFAWGTTTNLEQETSHASVGAGTGNVDFSQTLSGLSCGTTYFFENRAANSAGQDDGVTLEFTTAACGPPPGYPINVTTGTADSITETSAVLHGSANPNGAPSNGFFAYGIWPNLDYTFTVPIGSSRTNQPFSILLTGLSCGSEYLFDALANNDFGESNGGAKFFRTLDCGTSSPTSFYTLTPCRLVDTRNPSDPNGPAITENEGRIVVLAGKCGIPATAKAVSFNVTAVNPSAAGFLSLYPASAAPSSTSTINFRQGQVRANNGIVGLKNGAITVFCGLASSGSVDFVIDVNGYFQ